jgi:hypothetical protein
MAEMQLVPINPLNITGGHGKLGLEALAAEPLPIAIKLYSPDDPVLEAVLDASVAAAGAALEARVGDNVVLAGVLEDGDGSGPRRARLSLADRREGLAVHLPAKSLDWHLTGAGPESKLAIDSPELLIFPPEGDLSFAPRGIPLELLKSLAAIHRGSLAAAAVAAPWQAQVDQVFGNNPPRYDVFQGAPHYTDIPNWNNITFHLGRYLAARSDPNSLLNCYDAAAYLQILIRPSYPTRYCFMSPFGYLKLTDLIGRGQCNNPFTQMVAPQVVPQTLSTRTSFGNHAFCAPSQAGVEVIADACAGPHYADSPANYVAAAVDTITPNPPRPRAGTVADITYHRGVVNIVNLVRTGLDKVVAMTAIDPPFAASRPAFLDAIGARLTFAESSKAASGIPNPEAATALEGWELNHKDLVVGFPLSSRQWRFVRGDQSVVVTIWVANDPAAAFERFLQLGTAHQGAEPAFSRGPEGLGALSALSRAESRPTLIWTDANLAAQIETSSAEFDLAALAHQLSRGEAKEAMRSQPPEIGGLVLSAERIAVGDQFSVRVDASPEAVIDFAFSDDRATFETQSGNLLVFRARAAGPLEIAVAVTDPQSMLSARRSAEITILPKASAGSAAGS